MAQASSVRSSIEDCNRRFGAGVAKGDAAAIAGLYTEDAQVLPPGSDAVRGREAIRTMWQSVLETGIAGVTLTTQEVLSMGDVAAETGTYVLTGRNGSTADRGKYIVIWKKISDQWMLHRDIWNSSQTPAPVR